MLEAFQPLLDFLPEAADPMEQQGSLAGSELHSAFVFLAFGGFIVISLQIFIMVLLSSVLTLKSYRIGLRIKRLSKDPCPETTLRGMNK